MSPILLDTHVAIWAADGEITPSAAKEINAATLRGELLISPISAWEIAMLVRKGRLFLSAPIQDYVRALYAQRGVLTATLTPTIAANACDLPGSFAGDPADCILISTAAAYGAQLLTRDKAIHQYAKVTKHIRSIAC
jgi:PIN domain nuclease of toxin-antitoxin system